MGLQFLFCLALISPLLLMNSITADEEPYVNCEYRRKDIPLFCANNLKAFYRCKSVEGGKAVKETVQCPQSTRCICGRDAKCPRGVPPCKEQPPHYKMRDTFTLRFSGKRRETHAMGGNSQDVIGVWARNVEQKMMMKRVKRRYGTHFEIIVPRNDGSLDKFSGMEGGNCHHSIVNKLPDRMINLAGYTHVEGTKWVDRHGPPHNYASYTVDSWIFEKDEDQDTYHPLNHEKIESYWRHDISYHWQVTSFTDSTNDVEFKIPENC